jgi:glycosyltransferase involved in cell wall biosynthesis
MVAGIDDVVVFAGERPSEEVPAFLRAADVLVSPRSRGTNTPLKIYQYLRSGRPIVATRLVTHTQVLSDEVAVLTAASASEFARGILKVVGDRRLGSEIGRRAQDLASTKYSYEAYLERTRQACAALANVVGHSDYAGAEKSPSYKYKDLL